MTTVRDLRPGDVLDVGLGTRAMVVAVTSPHPCWPDLWLVCWKLDGPVGDDEGAAAGLRERSAGYSFDALAARQELGELISDRAGNADRWRRNMVGAGAPSAVVP